MSAPLHEEDIILLHELCTARADPLPWQRHASRVAPLEQGNAFVQALLREIGVSYDVPPAELPPPAPAAYEWGTVSAREELPPVRVRGRCHPSSLRVVVAESEVPPCPRDLGFTLGEFYSWLRTPQGARAWANARSTQGSDLLQNLAALVVGESWRQLAFREWLRIFLRAAGREVRLEDASAEAPDPSIWTETTASFADSPGLVPIRPAVFDARSGAILLEGTFRRDVAYPPVRPERLRELSALLRRVNSDGGMTPRFAFDEALARRCETLAREGDDATRMSAPGAKGAYIDRYEEVVRDVLAELDAELNALGRGVERLSQSVDADERLRVLDSVLEDVSRVLARSGGLEGLLGGGGASYRIGPSGQCTQQAFAPRPTLVGWARRVDRASGVVEVWVAIPGGSTFEKLEAIWADPTLRRRLEGAASAQYVKDALVRRVAKDYSDELRITLNALVDVLRTNELGLRRGAPGQSTAHQDLRATVLALKQLGLAHQASPGDQDRRPTQTLELPVEELSECPLWVEGTQLVELRWSAVPAWFDVFWKNEDGPPDSTPRGMPDLLPTVARDWWDRAVQACLSLQDARTARDRRELAVRSSQVMRLLWERERVVEVWSKSGDNATSRLADGEIKRYQRRLSNAQLSLERLLHWHGFWIADATDPAEPTVFREPWLAAAIGASGASVSIVHRSIMLRNHRPEATDSEVVVAGLEVGDWDVGEKLCEADVAVVKRTHPNAPDRAVLGHLRNADPELRSFIDRLCEGADARTRFFPPLGRWSQFCEHWRECVASIYPPPGSPSEAWQELVAAVRDGRVRVEFIEARQDDRTLDVLPGLIARESAPSGPIPHRFAPLLSLSVPATVLALFRAGLVDARHGAGVAVPWDRDVALITPAMRELLDAVMAPQGRMFDPPLVKFETGDMTTIMREVRGQLTPLPSGDDRDWGLRPGLRALGDGDDAAAGRRWLLKPLIGYRPFAGAAVEVLAGAVARSAAVEAGLEVDSWPALSQRIEQVRAELGDDFQRFVAVLRRSGLELSPDPSMTETEVARANAEILRGDAPVELRNLITGAGKAGVWKVELVPNLTHSDVRIDRVRWGASILGRQILAPIVVCSVPTALYQGMLPTQKPNGETSWDWRGKILDGLPELNAQMRCFPRPASRDNRFYDSTVWPAADSAWFFAHALLRWLLGLNMPPGRRTKQPGKRPLDMGQMWITVAHNRLVGRLWPDSRMGTDERPLYQCLTVVRADGTTEEDWRTLEVKDLPPTASVAPAPR